jgi:25S rRNA (uracil2634-N3)-methyltransferase
MGKSTKNLKAALKSQQSRLKANQRRLHANQVAEHKIRIQGQRGTEKITASGLKGKGKAKQDTRPLRRPTTPFKSTDSILLIGEGNFSFARALIQSPALELDLLPNNITATAYDSEQECYEKYPEARLIVSNLRSSGMEILFSVDGTCLEKNSSLKGRRWDRVVWNFPHAGELASLVH